MSKRRLSNSSEESETENETESEEVESGSESKSDTESDTSYTSESSSGESSNTSSELESGSESEEEDENMTLTHLAGQLSKKIPKDFVKQMLHSLITSKDILYWNSWGEMVYNQQRVPGTDISALLNYTLLPFNKKIKKPKGIDRFVEALAQLGLDKKLIQNKKVLAEVIVQENESEDVLSEEEFEKGSKNLVLQSGEGFGGSQCDNCGYPETGMNVIVVCPLCQWHDAFSLSEECVTCDICASPILLEDAPFTDRFKKCYNCHQIEWKTL